MKGVKKHLLKVCFQKIYIKFRYQPTISLTFTAWSFFFFYNKGEELTMSVSWDTKRSKCCVKKKQQILHMTPSLPGNFISTKHEFSLINHWTPICQCICKYSATFFSIVDAHRFHHTGSMNNQNLMEWNCRLI